MFLKLNRVAPQFSLKHVSVRNVNLPQLFGNVLINLHFPVKKKIESLLVEDLSLFLFCSCMCVRLSAGAHSDTCGRHRAACGSQSSFSTM